MTLNPNNYIRFFGGVELVKGVTSSLIYDLHREGLYQIPTLLYDVFVEFKDKTIQEVKTTFNHEYDEGIDLYLNKFLELELIFETDEKDAFPPNDYNDWDYPLRITNAILEIPKHDSYDLHEVLYQLDQLGCAQLQLRLIEQDNYSFSYFENVVESLKKSRIKIIELFLPESLFVDRKKLILFFNVNLRLSRVLFHSAPENKVMENENPLSKGRVVFLKEQLNYGQSDVVTDNTMFYNIQFFAEAIGHNVALNRKLCVNKDGLVMNYLSHSQVYGHVNDVSLETVISSDQFREKWFISNDHIEKCKDCQYRYACFFNSDIEKRNDQFFKTENCGFDPYADKWLAGT
ncbi:MAG: grasp-with-spasm system SPASM domain peptide maturase [Crocinitomicaceae bacterium]